MKRAVQIVYRRLTTADFYNINKPKGSEKRGGGQSYIDFPTSAVKPSDWAKFFAGQQPHQTHSGPLWRFQINSLGLGMSQELEIGQRRPASYNIRAQKLGTQRSNRVYAWHPKHSAFPAPRDPSKRTGIPNLVIYLLRADDGDYWAGWFRAAAPGAKWQIDDRLRPMFSKDQGTIYLEPPVLFDQNDSAWPFSLAATPAQSFAGLGAVAAPVAEQTSKKRIQFKAKTEEETIADLLAEDFADVEPRKRQVSIEVLKRNTKAISALKALYRGSCQISGETLTFKKLDGVLYCEGHHLVPLGKGGADSPYNIIVVSPLIHRMLHYARVKGIDLAKIKNNRLTIEINGAEYAIKWHPKHAELVEQATKKIQ